MIEYSVIDKLRCIERELRYRRVVYEKRIARNAMRPEQADWEIRCMEAIASDYRAQARASSPELCL